MIRRNHKEMPDFTGRLASYTVPITSVEPKVAFTVRVRILEMRRAYGRVEARICPTQGGGQAWARLDSLEVE